MFFEFKLTLDEANLVLGALSKFPYEQVSGLITNIKTQADPQIPRVQKEMEELAAAQKASQEAEQVEQTKSEVVNMSESKSVKKRKAAQQKVIETPEETGVPEYPASA